MITDIHTHNVHSTDGIICSTPGSFRPVEGKAYSCAIHPWETAATGNQQINDLCRILSREDVVAIGETGIDRMKGASAERQAELFKLHAILSEKLMKPLIIHEVKAAETILSIHKQIKPAMPWIRHGFRGNAQTARMYWSKGIYLSIGEKFNADAAASIPNGMLLIETDESRLTIGEIAAKVAEARQTTAEAILALSGHNISRILGGYHPTLA